MAKTKTEIRAIKNLWNENNREKVREYNRKSWEKNKEKRTAEHNEWLKNNQEWVKQYHKEYSKKYYPENKEKYSEQSRRWSKSNPEKWKEIIRKSKELHKDDIAKREKEYFKTLQGRYKRVRNSATARNKIFELSFEQFKEKVEQPCVYCGETEKRRGIDRVDNLIGYINENSVSCCLMCNYMKRTYGLTEFLEHIKKIHEHNN